MRKVAVLFVLAVFIPSLVLAWLALRSLRDQQIVIERQQSVLYQGVTDRAAKRVQDLMAQHQQDFSRRIEAMLARNSAREIAASFDERLKTNWPPAKVGFVVTTGGDILSPGTNSRKDAQLFRELNESFLENREPAEVYVNNSLSDQPLAQNTSSAGIQSSERTQLAAPRQTASRAAPPPSSSQNMVQLKSAPTRAIQPQKKLEPLRKEQPLQDAMHEQELSKIAPAEAEFKQLIGNASQGTLARFVDNQLSILFWYRPAEQPRYIFGAQLDLASLVHELAPIVAAVDRQLRTELCIALLNDAAKPVALSDKSFQGDWKRPFVATEIGETLPHWEVAAYLLNPGQLTASARTVRFTVSLLVALLIVAIGTGSWLIVRDLNRHLQLARQKTDFVSNVSHELKTPLTAIRMFSEMLAEGRVTDPGRQRSYLNIITAETSRLTRLINNVLDFSRMDRGEKKYDFRDCDLNQLVRETTESYRPHLENHQFTLNTEFEADAIKIHADCDAISQVILNLLSNAEKYSGEQKDVCVTVSHSKGSPPFAEVRIADRGLGVPAGAEERIFEQFYRAHDSLSSGIQGSGLGLTLARQIARAHGGDVTCERREGGGSVFCLRLPWSADTSRQRATLNSHYENENPGG